MTGVDRETAALQDLTRARQGVVSRAQLRSVGVDRHEVRRRVGAGTWQVFGAKVVITHGGPPTRDQLRRAAVVHAGPRAALAGLTALESHGLDGWSRDEMHVVVPAGTHVTAHPDLVIHRSHRLAAEDVMTIQGLRLTTPPRSALDAARWDRSAHTSGGVILACVQQGLAEPDQIDACLSRFSVVRQQVAIVDALENSASGSDSLSEVIACDLARDVGFPEPVRQWKLETSMGTRFVDLAVPLLNGRFLAIEVDGPHHDIDEVRVVDMAKDAALLQAGHLVVRIRAAVLRHDPLAVRLQLGELYRSLRSQGLL
jgi:hypothetical protein